MDLRKPEGVTVCLIAAVDKNGAIGTGNKLPWHHPLEMKYFRQMTINGTVLMGANTWRSLDCKPLVQRRNIVLTSDPEQFGEPPLDTHFISDPNEAFKLLKSDELLVIGGAAAAIGAKRAKSAVPPAPERTVESVQRDVATVKEHL